VDEAKLLLNNYLTFETKIFIENVCQTRTEFHPHKHNIKRPFGFINYTSMWIWWTQIC